MFKPDYRVTNYLIQRLEKIASEAALIERSPIRLPVRITLENEVFNRNVHSSTGIEGNVLSLDQVAALSRNKDVIAERREKLEVANCIVALRWAIKNASRPLTEARLLRLHALMTKGLLEPAKSGRYRAVQNYIVNGQKFVVFTPPPPAKVKERMRSLFSWLKSSPDTHAVVLSAVFHHEFVTVHPFTDGNGRVARAAAQWVLWDKGYRPLNTLGLDEFFARDRKQYYEKIRQARELDYDYTHWVEYVAEGLLDSVERVAVRVKELARLSQGKALVLTPRQEELLGLLASRGALGSAEIGRLMNIQRARVNHLVQPLVKAGIVVKEGTTRGARYSPGR